MHFIALNRNQINLAKKIIAGFKNKKVCYQLELHLEENYLSYNGFFAYFKESVFFLNSIQP